MIQLVVMPSLQVWKRVGPNAINKFLSVLSLSILSIALYLFHKFHAFFNPRFVFSSQHSMSDFMANNRTICLLIMLFSSLMEQGFLITLKISLNTKWRRQQKR